MASPPPGFGHRGLGYGVFGTSRRRASFGRAFMVSLDDDASVERAVETIPARAGCLDAVLNSADRSWARSRHLGRRSQGTNGDELLPCPTPVPACAPGEASAGRRAHPQKWLTWAFSAGLSGGSRAPRKSQGLGRSKRSDLRRSASGCASSSPSLATRRARARCAAVERKTAQTNSAYSEAFAKFKGGFGEGRSQEAFARSGCAARRTSARRSRAQAALQRRHALPARGRSLERFPLGL
jgi:hypothetical protein